jgi:hypothetical protein
MPDTYNTTHAVSPTDRGNTYTVSHSSETHTFSQNDLAMKNTTDIENKITLSYYYLTKGLKDCNKTAMGLPPVTSAVFLITN